MNSARESPSGNFHGMVVRALLGDAPAGLEPPFGVNLRPEQLVLAGARDLDPAEAACIQERGVRCLSTPDLAATPGHLVEALQATGARKLHIHLDLDVLDPGCFPHVSAPAAGGLERRQLLALVRSLLAPGSAFDGHLAGVTLTEFRPVGTEAGAGAGAETGGEGTGGAGGREVVAEAVAFVAELLGPAGLDLRRQAGVDVRL
jgi:arginase